MAAPGTTGSHETKSKLDIPSRIKARGLKLYWLVGDDE